MPDQPPLVWLAALAIMGAIGAIATVGPAVWYQVVWRLCHRHPVLEHEPRRLAHWGLIDLVLVVVLLFVAMSVLAAAASILGFDVATSLSGDDKRGRFFLILISSVAQMIAAALAAGFILLRTGCSPGDLGFSLGAFGRDLGLGTAAFCALAIPTYAIQIVLTQFWPSVHPVIESLKADRDPQFLVIGMFAAVIAAPLTEEFVFRVLFQGWLEKMFDPAAIFRPNFVGRLFAGERVEPASVAALPPDVIQAELAEPRSIYLGPPPIDDPRTTNPYQPPGAGLWPDVESQTARFPHWVTDVIPITVTAALFALMHWSHGPDFIPLFFLAIGLGYLYRRTHRITPSLVVHFLLNLMSMLVLCVQIYGKDIPT